MKLQESMTGFYYVGTKRANISKLVNIYKRGYASGNLNRAIEELTNKEHLVPEVIFCESGFGFSAIADCAELLAKNERLQHVPFIIDAETVSPVENYHFNHNRTVDDIINLKAWDENNLNMKVRFLQSYKGQPEEKEKETVTKAPPKKNSPAPFSLHRIIQVLAGFL